MRLEESGLCGDRDARPAARHHRSDRAVRLGAVPNHPRPGVRLLHTLRLLRRTGDVRQQRLHLASPVPRPPVHRRFPGRSEHLRHRRHRIHGLADARRGVAGAFGHRLFPRLRLSGVGVRGSDVAQRRPDRGQREHRNRGAVRHRSAHDDPGRRRGPAHRQPEAGKGGFQRPHPRRPGQGGGGNQPPQPGFGGGASKAKPEPHCR